MPFAYAALAPDEEETDEPDVPPDTPFLDWPDGWPWPPDIDDGPWPPGWEQDVEGDEYTLNTVLDEDTYWTGSPEGIGLTCTTLKEGADTGDFLGQRIAVYASVNGVPVQVRKEESDDFADMVFYAVTNYSGLSYGFADETFFADVDSDDFGETLTVTCQVVGFIPAVLDADTAEIGLTPLAIGDIIWWRSHYSEHIFGDQAGAVAITDQAEIGRVQNTVPESQMFAQWDPNALGMRWYWMDTPNHIGGPAIMGLDDDGGIAVEDPGAELGLVGSGEWSVMAYGWMPADGGTMYPIVINATGVGISLAGGNPILVGSVNYQVQDPAGLPVVDGGAFYRVIVTVNRTTQLLSVYTSNATPVDTADATDFFLGAPAGLSGINQPPGQAFAFPDGAEWKGEAVFGRCLTAAEIGAMFAYMDSQL